MNNYPKLGPIIIGTKSIKDAETFYKAVFGIVIEEKKQNYLRAKMHDGTLIELEEDSPNRFPNWKRHNIGTYKNSQFMVTDLQHFLGVVQQHGGNIISPIKEKPWGSTAEIADIDGNIFLIGEET